jgi:outer membrane protein assembly factor BamD
VFYYKTKHYKAALNRFMSIISDYADVGYHQQALEYIAKSEAALAEEESK